MSLGRVSQVLCRWRGSGSASALRVGVCGAWGTPHPARVTPRRELSHVPVDDLISGLSEEQTQVSVRYRSV